ncbi:MAG: dihydroneopterin aldolase [Bacteroidales bacterium]|nr:dihydroneopterin aldolase [Bacteroidales bacterium]
MKTFIELNDITFYAYHGVMPQENIVGNNFEVNIKIGIDYTKAIENDDLDGTINYAEIYDIIKKEMDIPSKLLEHIAGRIINSLISKWNAIYFINIKLSKCKPPIDGDVKKASVIIEWNK